jgi:hypothetical protein
MKFPIYEKKNVPNPQPVPLKPYVSEATREKRVFNGSCSRKPLVFLFLMAG